MKNYPLIIGFFVVLIVCAVSTAFSLSWPLAYLYGIYLVAGTCILVLLLWLFGSYSAKMQALEAYSDNKLQEDIFFTEQLHKHIYQEPITGLGNRFYLENKLQYFLSHQESLGALFLLELQGLKQFNDVEGHLAGDEFLKKIAQVLKENSFDIKANFIARIGGTSFALIAPQSTPEEVEHRVICLLHAVEDVITSSPRYAMLQAHIGVAFLSGVKTSSELLSFADLALKKARATHAAFSYAYYQEKTLNEANALISNAQTWEKHIQELIREDKITVIYQPVLSIPHKKVLSEEAFLRVKTSEGSLSEAKYIVPMADRFGFTFELDRCVIQQVQREINARQRRTPYTVNLSASTLLHEPARQWLLKTLSDKHYKNKIVLECDEHTVLNHFELVKHTMQELQKCGIGFGLDYTGYDFVEYKYLKQLRFQYLKIDGSVIGSLQHINTQFFVRFLSRLAHSLDMLIIAKSVETAEQWEILQSCRFDGAQGYFLSGREDEGRKTS